MVGDGGRGARMHVRGRAHLERYPPVADERGEPTQLDGAVVADRDVVDDPDAVPEPLGARELERLPDRRQPERFTGMDGDVEVLAADVLEGIEVAGRRIALLRPRDVEPDDARVAPADRAFRDLDGAGGLAHGRHEHLHDDRMAGRGGPLGPDLEPLEVRGDDLVERHAPFRRELRGVAHLSVGDAVRGEILGALRGDADDGVAFLHDADGVGEGLEVELERLAVGAATDMRREFVGVGRRQTGVAVFRGQVDDRGRSQAAVEMVVQEGLGCRLDRLGSQHRRPMVQGADGMMAPR